VAGNYAYMTGSYGLEIIDVSNPAAPTLKGSYDTAGYSLGVAVRETMHMWLMNMVL